ncbi:MAG: hypothetical protein AB7G17_02615 [Phycisphaerales bacterium]
MLVASIVLAASSLAGQPDARPDFPLQKAAAENPMHTAIRSLVGRWESDDNDGDGKPEVVCEYRTTAGGSAVVETLFPGQPEEMVTIYHLDGDSIGVTHYCMMGNQPYLKSIDGSTAKRISFECAGGPNVDRSGGDYMGSLVLEIGDDGKSLTQHWGHFTKGAKAGEMAFELHRTK